MIELLAIAAGLDGALLFILGAFYLFSAFTDHEMMTKAERYRLGVRLGLMMLALGISSLFVFYTGGLGPYLQRGGSAVLGFTALAARGIAAVLLLVLIIDSLKIWRRARRDVEEGRRGRAVD